MDVDIFRVVTSELKLCTLGELKTVRSVIDLRDYIEIIEVYEALEIERIAADKKRNESPR